MRILFLHGWQSVVGGVKPTFLVQAGHDVSNPALDHDDFERALATAQEAFDRQRPAAVVGSSRGGALAMNLRPHAARLVLLCPAWRKYGSANTVRAGSVILHSRADEVVPFVDSEELVRASRLPPSTLIETGADHRLADPRSLELMLRACSGDQWTHSGCCV